MVWTAYRDTVCLLCYGSQTGEVRRIFHLNFTAWPDHDTPSQPDALLTFIAYMRHIHGSGPITTHCSAGIGRSGTLICIDVVLGLISQDLEVSAGWALSTRGQGQCRCQCQALGCLCLCEAPVLALLISAWVRHGLYCSPAEVLTCKRDVFRREEVDFWRLLLRLGGNVCFTTRANAKNPI